jgi:peptidoglycan/LPS O-acetylase OafA/YrhL
LQGVGQNLVLDQGVSFFFVLSGFILTYVYRRLDSQKATAKFLLARLARIWPCHIAALVCTMLLVPIRFHIPQVAPADSFNFWKIICAQVFLVHDWVPYYQLMGAFNPASWTISAEWFFYLCFPVMLAMTYRSGFRAVDLSLIPLALLMFVCAYCQLPTHGHHLCLDLLLYASPFARLFEFALGVAFGVYFLRNGRSLASKLHGKKGSLVEIGALALVCLVVTQTNLWCDAISKMPEFGMWAVPLSFWLAHGGITAFPFAILVTVFAFQSGWVSRMLRFPQLVILGELSFAIYMFHGPLLLIWQDWHLPFTETGMLLFMTTLVVVSYIVWTVIEKPARKFMVSTGGKIIDRLMPVKKAESRPARPLAIR